jgi:hypothetical protein
VLLVLLSCVDVLVRCCSRESEEENEAEPGEKDGLWATETGPEDSGSRSAACQVTGCCVLV